MKCNDHSTCVPKKDKDWFFIASYTFSDNLYCLKSKCMQWQYVN